MAAAGELLVTASEGLGPALAVWGLLS